VTGANLLLMFTEDSSHIHPGFIATCFTADWYKRKQVITRSSQSRFGSSKGKDKMESTTAPSRR
jgi:hypothetical protein